MTWPAAVLTHFAARLPYAVHWLLWATVKPFGGGAAVSVGLWTGDDHETIVVEGQARLYHGAQGGLQVPPIAYRVGTEVASLDLGLSLSPEGVTLVRGYNTRLAPVQLHAAVFDADTGGLLGLRRMFKGLVDGVRIATPEQEGQAALTLTLVSAARRGTMTVAGRKSDQSQRARLSTDRFRQYADVGSVAADTWGTD
ncbi:hypothetical protein [Rubellimicrobium aerolatum]|uniref:DUF2125 domain-containing protein n=1 Tax=Rubellimicrobium aerolatum TaxID=490979 RepID=A0ABW0SEW1_9RHOB|nr:hypothetical protein [Rubellimicrobium aerolatum]MBP1806457.1 hypothetical protein [Rubellimicrobium aerolatum]